MIHLDTHVVVWLYTKKDHSRIPVSLRNRLEAEPLAISPAVRLELAFLAEIGRLVDQPGRVIGELKRAIGLRVDDTPFDLVAETACGLTFTRNPFDRLIAAQATCAGAELATKDGVLREHLDNAVWDE